MNKIYIFQCMGKILCVERVHFKFPTKYLSHTLKHVISMPRSESFWNAPPPPPPPPPPQDAGWSTRFQLLNALHIYFQLRLSCTYANWLIWFSVICIYWISTVGLLNYQPHFTNQFTFEMRVRYLRLLMTATVMIVRVMIFLPSIVTWLKQ